MKCDLLEVELQLKRRKTKKIEYDFDYKVRINSVEFTEDFDFMSIFYDTHLRPKYEYQKPYCEYPKSEYDQHNRAIKRFDGIVSSVYFNSCSCGDPGCSGYYNGIRVYKKKKYFKYVAKKSDGYDKGILNSGKYNITLTHENVFTLRNYICDFFIKNKNKLDDTFTYFIDQCENYIKFIKKHK